MKIFRVIVLGLCLIVVFSGPLPAREIEGIDHERIISRIAEYEGQVVVVNFWASWCPPCRLEIPHLVRLREKHDPADVLILGVSLDEDVAAAQEFLHKNDLNYPVFRGREGVGQFFRVSGLPTTIVYDKDKIKVFSHTGYLSEEKLKDIIQKHLK
ncbi:MAG: TlpA family protein disulfide reductase [Desulfonatronovibrionaceae bacterium]